MSLVLQQVQATAAMLLELHSVSAKRSAHQANIALLHAAATLSSGDLAVVVSDINGYGVVALRDYNIGDVLTEFGGLLTTVHDMRQLPAARSTHVRMVHDASGAARDGSLLATWFQQMSPDQRAAELRLPMHLRTRLTIDVARISLPGATQLQGTHLPCPHPPHCPALVHAGAPVWPVFELIVSVHVIECVLVFEAAAMALKLGVGMMCNTADGMTAAGKVNNAYVEALNLGPAWTLPTPLVVKAALPLRIGDEILLPYNLASGSPLHKLIIANATLPSQIGTPFPHSPLDLPRLPRLSSTIFLHAFMSLLVLI